LLLACSYDADIIGVGATGEAIGAELFVLVVGRSIASGVVKQNFGNVGILEEWEGEL